MVEFILISVAVVAVIMFAVNIRSLRGSSGETRMLDGSPHWEQGVVATVERTGEYLGLPTAKLTLTLGDKECELAGPLPKRFADRIQPGMAVEGHLEYEMLDTLRTELWDAAPAAVLSEVARLLDTGTTPSTDEPRVLTFERDGRTIELCIAEDGWMVLMYFLAAPHDVSLDLRADFELFENAHMLTERLGVLPDPENAAALERLSAGTLATLEDFAVSVDGWICIDNETIDLECALPFPEAELVVTMIETLVPAMAVMERELSGAGDEVW